MGSYTETAIYLGTALATVLWSVWIYLAWLEKAGLPEESARRWLAIFSPSVWLLAMALAGWRGARVVRLDLAGMLALDALTLLCALGLLAVRGLRGERARRACAGVLLVYNGTALLLAAAFHLVRAFPPLLIGVAGLVGQARRLDLSAFAWAGLDPETHQHDLESLLNKLLVAVLSYIPIALARTAVLARQRRRMQREIVELRLKVEGLEGRLAGAAAGAAQQAERGSVTVKVVP